LSINYEIEKYIKRADENPAIKRVAINFAIATIGQNAKAKLSLTQTPPRREMDFTLFGMTIGRTGTVFSSRTMVI
jgi:hypothetical protein